MKSSVETRSRPIVFSGESVPKILSQMKTQSRRVERRQPILIDNRTWEWPYPTKKLSDGSWRASKASWARDLKVGSNESMRRFCPYGAIGDRLWVKESWRIGDWDENTKRMKVDYKADGLFGTEWIKVSDDAQFDRLWCQSTDDAVKVYGNVDRFEWDLGESPCRWRNLRFMPRWASRISLELCDIGFERLQDITEEDALADGGWIYAKCPFHKAPIVSYHELWDLINAKRGYPWESNPWIWKLTFRLIDKR